MCGMIRLRWTTKQLHLLAVVQAQRLSLWPHYVNARQNRCEENLKIPWRTGGAHQDALILRGWRLSSMTWNPLTSPWMKQLKWLWIVHCGDWCLRFVLCSAPPVMHVRNEWLNDSMHVVLPSPLLWTNKQSINADLFTNCWRDVQSHYLTVLLGQHCYYQTTLIWLQCTLT